MGFKVGDVVELKSGGPYMTVKAVSNDSVTAVWFNNEGAKYSLETSSFHPQTLKMK